MISDFPQLGFTVTDEPDIENPVFLILAVALLFAEWFLRRRFNLF